MALFTDKQMGLGAVVAVVGLWYVSRKAGNVAEKAIDAVNPLNDDNIFSDAVNATGSKIMSNPGWTLGGAVYDYVDWWQDVVPFVESDAERITEIERRAKEQYLALEKYRKTGGF